MTGRLTMLAAALLVSACASSPARSSAKVPLVIPEPPPRVAMDPVPAVVAETPAAPERPPVTPASQTAKPAPPPPASAAAVPPPAAPTTAVTVPEPPRTTPPPELRPAGPAGTTPSAAQVRERVTKAKQKLESIDRRRLSTAGKRTDYDSARRFLSQAEAAVKANNLLLAESSVEKVETLAEGLR
jgi:hypothetical protein